MFKRPGPNKKCAAAFKSPMRGAPTSTSTDDKETVSMVTEDIKQLEGNIKETDQQIDKLLHQGYREEELQIHIQKLHEYNEIKDVGQMLLGKIAMEEGCTTKQMYQEMGLELED